MALVLQESGIGRAEWLGWISRVPGFRDMLPERVSQLLAAMLGREILWDEDGILGMGRVGEDTYGRQNFMELLSVFTSPPLFSILHGRQELGYVDQLTFLGKQEGPRILLLGGRAWKVNHIDWQRRRAYVETAEAKGRTRWQGRGQGLGLHLSQEIRSVLTATSGCEFWSVRATERIAGIRHDFAWLRSDSTVALQNGTGEVEWWTFGGNRANATLAAALAEQTHQKVDHDDFKLTFETGLKLQDVQDAIRSIAEQDVPTMFPIVNEEAIEGLKFSECLPLELAIEMLKHRLQDQEATRHVIRESVRCIIMQHD